MSSSSSTPPSPADVVEMPRTRTEMPTYNGDMVSYLYDFSRTPYPALLNSAMLLATPTVSPQLPLQMVAYNSHKGSTFANFANKHNIKKVGLSSKNALLFGMANLAGSWMIYDDDLENGSGFIMAWSTLYLLMNGKKSYHFLKFGKVWPLLLSGVALGNTAIYGKRFITGQFK